MKKNTSKKKTAEERMATTNRMIKLTTIFVALMAGVIICEMVMSFVSDKVIINNWATECSSLGVLVCALSINISNKKKLEAEIADKSEE